MCAKCCLVVTTIGDGGFLEKYANQIIQEQVLDDIDIVIIPDNKTPHQLFNRCEQLKQKGISIVCPTLEEQDIFLRRLGEIQHIIPINSDNRRNIGFLMALERDCDFIISIDDDNFCRAEQPFFREHAVVERPEVELTAVHSENGWFNICDLMEVQPPNVYPRGFPYRFRHQSAEIERHIEWGHVHLNAGLWLGDPDLDAITWLANPARARSFSGQSVLLGQTTWSPINTQNTAVHRDAIAAYYFVKMGHSVAGMQIDRYGDIFSGYFCQACVRHLGYRIRIGTPVVDHIRNTHNYLRDLTNELACIWLIEDIVEWLQELRLEGSTYTETYLSLADALEDAVERFSGFIWNDSTRGYFHQMAYCMRVWVQAVRTLGLR
jgi:hypothetical protein